MFIKSVSPTKISTYDECHLKFRYKYLDKLPDIFNDGASTDALQFGSYIHRVFELGYECETVEEIHEIAKEVRPNFEFEGYGPKKIANCIENFFEFNKTLTETVGVEHRFEVDVDSFSVNGVIDRVIIGENGGILVLDYKTSKKMKTPSELYSDPQMLMYAFAAHKLYDVPYSDITLGHYYPTQNKLVTIKIPKGRVEQYITRKLKEKVWEIRKRKKDEFRAMHNNFCNWCGYKDICPNFHSNPVIEKTLDDKKELIEEAKAAQRAYWKKLREEKMNV